MPNSQGDPATGGRWDGLVVMCAGMAWDDADMAHKHIATRLAAFAPVLFVDPPRSVARVARASSLRAALSEPRLKRVNERIARLTPVTVPGVSRPGLRRLAQLHTRRLMAGAVRELGGSVHAVIVGSFDALFGACGERMRVFYGTDDFAAGGELMDLSPRWLERQERNQLARADRIVAVSSDLAQRWSELGYTVDIVTNGCDVDRYADLDGVPAPADVTLPRPIAGVVGQISERIDLSYLEAVADTGHSLLMVGPHHGSFDPERVAALADRPNVQWVGRKPAQEMPSYLKVMSVGLTPYAASRFNRGSFPLKTLEYLAAGIRAVSTDLPATRALNTDLITTAASPREFAAAAAHALSSPVEPTERRQRQAFARLNSWDQRTIEFARLLGLA